MIDAWDNERQWARTWMIDAALPIWWRVGADRAHGGFIDRIDQDGTAISGPKRARVQARQTFVFAEAGKLGWSGPWQDAVNHGVAFLLDAFRRDDGLFRKTVTAAGEPHDDDVDLYDQAFVLFGLASAYTALGKPPALLAEAERLLQTLRAKLPHPTHGFEEANPRRLPLRSNPHMHMLEALLAWVEADGGPLFRAHAEEIVALAVSRLIDPATGAIGEYYDGDWRFAAGLDGTIREPGHQFEWAYLLDRAGRTLGGDHTPMSRALERFGARHGIDTTRQVAVFSLDATGVVVDADARLWAQSERLRTALVLGRHTEDADEAAKLDGEARHAFATLRRFLDVPIEGLWYDRLLPGGQFVHDSAPASSFYHILTGLLPLLDTVER